MARKKKTEKNVFFDLVHGAIKEGVEALESGKKLTVREVEMPSPPKPMSARQIASLREKKLHVSQPVFAAMLNASPQSVHAWEQGRKEPSGIALRLLRLMDGRPGLFSGRSLVGKRAKPHSATKARRRAAKV